MDNYSVVIAGTGNVASHMSLAIYRAGFIIKQIYGRNESQAKKLAGLVKTEYTTIAEKIVPNADIYILAVSDNAIEEVRAKLPPSDNLVVHTSGSTSLDVLSNHFSNAGVIYPVQTLSRQVEIDFLQVPLLLEASNSKSMKILRSLAEKISKRIEYADSSQRLRLHLAAVFACNFTNHFYSIAEELLKDKNISFEILKPLIFETCRKIENNKPSVVQTGPAVREDRETMKKHIRELEGYFSYQNLYTFVSESIVKKYKNDS